MCVCMCPHPIHNVPVLAACLVSAQFPPSVNCEGPPGDSCSTCYCHVAKLCPTLCDPTDCSLLGSSVHRISQANTGVGCHFLLRGIFLTQGSNPGLLHWQVNSLPLSYQGSPMTKVLCIISVILKYYDSTNCL